MRGLLVLKAQFKCIINPKKIISDPTKGRRTYAQLYSNRASTGPVIRISISQSVFITPSSGSLLLR